MADLREEITRRFLRYSKAGRQSTPDVSNVLGETTGPTDPREGRQFGAYRILRRVGRGGMGHVYLALDTRLGRHAALKFLPPELLSDRSMLQQLEQEARCASALNHPNILTIYEIGQAEGELFIASEFVEGVTLRTAMLRGGIDGEMALRVAIQIASALTAAHSTGVIHRDLKPANIMLRPDGYVKIIDFGLAILASDSGIRSGYGSAGSVVGTVEYMSPEQARGDEVDGRSDLWSLGVLLYEMLSQERPFTGDTHSHVIVAILDQPAPPLPNAANLPEGAARVVTRALVKEPARRYSSAAEMLADLEQLSPISKRLLPSRPSSGTGRHRSLRALTLTGSLLVLLLLSAIGLWKLRGRLFGPEWFRVESVRRLTFNGRTYLSAISPDGRYLAFVVGEPGGLESLHLKQIDQPSDEVRIPSRRIIYRGITFAPDGHSLYEVEKENDTLLGRLFVVPLVGQRPAAPILQDIDGPISFSPSGDSFAFVRYRQLPAAGGYDNQLWLARASGAGLRLLFSSRDQSLFRQVAWSPGGDRIATIISQASGAGDQLLLQSLPLHGPGRPTPLPQWSYVGQPWWTPDGRSIVISASAETEAKNHAQIRQVALATGEARDITKDLSGYSSVTLTHDGLAMAAVKIDSAAGIWVSKPRDWGRGRASLSESPDNVSLAWLDRTRLLVNSHRTGYPNLAVFATGEQATSALTDAAYVEQQAAVVPGGRSVVLCSNRSGGFHIWRYDLPSNRYWQLTFGQTYDDSPAVTPDGRWVVYTAWSQTSPHLYRVPVAGGQPISLTPRLAANPQISADGRRVACRIESAANQWFIGVFPLEGGGEVAPVPGAQLPMAWAPSGDSLTSSITDSSGVSNLWNIPLNGSAPRQLTSFEDQTILAFAWSPDGARLACIRLALGSDVELLKRQH